MKKYKVKFSDGEEYTVSTKRDAGKIVCNKYPNAFWDLDRDRILVWESESDSENDDGQRAVASIITLDSI